MLFSSRPVSWLVVFLGNPGPKYECPRHNAGFMAADALAKKLGVSINRARFKALTASAEINGEKVLLMKPQTFMNLSGEAVGEAARFYKVPPEHVIVVSDEVSLPLGKLRVRPKGSAGGHNGLKSINNLLGSQQWARLRFGVGNDFPPGAQVDYVLGYPTPEELAILPERAKVAVDAIKAFCLSGVTFAMNNYNNK